MKIVTKSTFFTSMIIVTGLSFTACSSTTKPQPQPQPQPQHQVQPKPQTKPQHIEQKPQDTQAQKNIAYKNAMHKVGITIKQDMNYQKLDLSTPELKDWFTDITYKLWDHQIDRGQFIAFGLEKFPKHNYEFNLIANGLLAN